MQDPNLANGEKRTIVEDGTHLEGSLSSSCPIVVNGKIEGEVVAPSLKINDTGSVRGKVMVEEIESTGEMSGEFEADVVRLSGVLRDDSILRAKSLEVKLAAPNDPRPIVFGACSLEIGEMPDKEAVIRASREGLSIRPPAEPVVRASAPPAAESIAAAVESIAAAVESIAAAPESIAGVSDEVAEASPVVAEGRSKRRAAAAAKRP